MRKLTDAEARQRAWDYAEFTPYADVPFPGTSVPWPGPCPLCGRAEIAPRLATLQRRRGTACRPCSLQKTWAARRADPERNQESIERSAASSRLTRVGRAANRPRGHRRVDVGP